MLFSSSLLHCKVFNTQNSYMYSVLFAVRNLLNSKKKRLTQIKKKAINFPCFLKFSDTWNNLDIWYNVGIILLHDDQVFDLQPIKMGSLASESTFLSLARTFIIKKKNVGLLGLYSLLLLHDFFWISGENENGWWKDTAWIQNVRMGTKMDHLD